MQLHAATNGLCLRTVYSFPRTFTVGLTDTTVRTPALGV